MEQIGSSGAKELACLCQWPHAISLLIAPPGMLIAAEIRKLAFTALEYSPQGCQWFFYLFCSFLSYLFKDLNCVSSQKFPRKLYFSHWWKCMEGIPLGRETVSIFSPNTNTKKKTKKTNCILRSFLVQNFEVSSSEERCFPFHIPARPLPIAILC